MPANLSRDQIKALIVEAKVPIRQLMQKLNPQELPVFLDLAVGDKAVTDAMGGVKGAPMYLPGFAGLARMGVGAARGVPNNLVRRGASEAAGESSIAREGGVIAETGISSARPANLIQRTASEAAKAGEGPSGGRRGVSWIAGMLAPLLASLQGQSSEPQIQRRRLQEQP